MTIFSRTLLVTFASAALILAPLPAFAGGGSGGGGINAGGGGTNNATGTGGNGGGGAAAGTGGGGGGAGTPGGTGGAGNGGGAGGAGGAVPGAAGAAGIADGAGNGGGGGGGGSHGQIVTVTTINAGAISGGAGGAGGSAIAAGYGGGGGGGGYGVVVNGAGLSYTNSSTITGGAGGAGGSNFANSGNGGDGGYGMLFINGGTLNNSGGITGGAGGTGTVTGAGGVGVSGAGLAIVNSGSINGGLGGDGATRANAITFTGGTNSLTLQSTGSITGNVVAFSTADTLAFGSAGSSTFDVSKIGAAAQYQGFGVFQKIDSGTWTLFGTASTAIPWTVTAGTLAVNSAAAISANSSFAVASGATLDLKNVSYTVPTLTGAGTVLIDEQGDNPAPTPLTLTLQAGTFTGTITQNPVNTTGPAFLNGQNVVIAGPVTLAGTNSWTGTTTINSGATLTLGNGGTGGNVPTGTLTDNGTLAFNHSDTVTVNVITGTGGITQAGTGTTTLSFSNTISGPVSVTAGTLSFVTGGLGTGAITVNGGTLLWAANNSSDVSSRLTIGTAGGTIDTGSNLVTFASALTSTGAFTKAGAGTLILTGSDSFGPTTISAGTLQIGNGNTSGTIAGAIVDNSVLALSRSDNVTFANVVTGTGGLIQGGAGTTILTGANTYSGITYVATGTLQVGSGGTAGSLGTGAVTDNGSLVFNRSDSVTLPNSISGTGSFTQSGSGNLILTGASTFTGTTTVSAGTLSVNGSLAGPVSVASGGKLGGTGTTGAVTVASGGTLAPGNSIGTISVASLILASGSSYNVEVSPTAADRTNVTGAASINGTLALTQIGGTYVATTYRLIQAGSLTGTFSSVTGNTFTGLTSTVQYSATAVDLVLSAPTTAAATTAATPAPTVTYLFNSYGRTPNQIAAGAALTAAPPTGALYLAMGALVGSNVAAVPAALGQLAGDIHPSLRAAAIEDSRIIRDTVVDRIGKATGGITLWGTGFGGYGSIATDANAAALHHDTGGFIVGVDTAAGHGLRFGLAGAYSANSSRTADRTASVSGTSGHVIGYAGWSDGAYDLRAGGDFGWGTNNVARNVTLLSQSVSDTQNQNTSQVFADAGYHVALNTLMLEPYIAIAHVEANDGGFAETGGTAALSGAAKTDRITYGSAGLRASLDDLMWDTMRLTPRVDLAWQHAFNRLRPGQIVSFQNAGQSFLVLGTPLAMDAAAMQAGLDFAVTPNATISIAYDGSFSSTVQNNAVRGGISWTF